MKILRKKTIAGETVEFKFDVSGSQFVITNFTEQNIIAKIGEKDSTGVLIPGGTAKVVATRIPPRLEDMASTIYVDADETKESGCEVQILDY